MSVSGRYAHAYAAYLNSPEWQKQRKGALERAGRKCERCQGEDMLEVHHLTYDRLSNERPEDLRVLCNPCHSDEHGRPARGQPVVSVKAAFLKAWGSKGEQREDLEEQQQQILDEARTQFRRGNVIPSGAVGR